MIPELTIENIIASTHLGSGFDLEQVREGLGPDVAREAPFDGLVLEQAGYRTVMLLFTRGRLVCTGARNFNTLERAIADAVTRLKDCGVDAGGVVDVDVLNIIASATLGDGLRLERLRDRAKDVEARYDPDYFEGLEMELTVGPKDEPVTVLLFESGRMVFTGATEVETLEAALERTAELLAEAGDGIYASDE
jgi:transcription initiation factor TFIID TATA-box-binding protein